VKKPSPAVVIIVLAVLALISFSLYAAVPKPPKPQILDPGMRCIGTQILGNLPWSFDAVRARLRRQRGHAPLPHKHSL
jgi:hypothetical protein